MTRAALRTWGPAAAVLATLGLMMLAREAGAGLTLPPAARAWVTLTIAIVVQAVPFLVLGVVVSGLIAAFVPATWFARVAPRNGFLAVPAAGCAGMVLPGCECASVPVARSLIRRGVPRPAALAFMLAAPAVNPVVLVATAVAFAGQPAMVWARLLAAMLAVVVIGWAWVAFGRDHWMTPQPAPEHAGSRIALFRESVLHDLVHAGGFLALGAMVAALIKVAAPRDWFVTLANDPGAAVMVMAALAVLLALCSEADAFIAASFVSVSPVAQLVFLTVGPMVDVKLIAMQYGAFGRDFVARFVPLTLCACVASASLVGALLLGL